MDKEVKKIFWTGGMDSTFAVINFLHQGFNVQPYYLIWNAFYHQKEIDTQNEIRNIIEKHKELQGKLLPTIYVPNEYNELNDFPEEMRKAWHSVFIEQGKLPIYVGRYTRGFQYLRLALLPLEFDGTAIGITGYDTKPGDLRRLLETNGHMAFDENNIGYFPKDKCDKDIYKVFGRFTYPIANISERKFFNLYQKWGFSDVLSRVRFCHNEKTYHGDRCGFCLPCQVKFSYGMYEFFTEDSWKRAYVCNKITENKMYVNTTPMLLIFANYCNIKIKNPNANILEMSRLMGVPLNVCEYINRELRDAIPPKEIRKRLGKYVFISKKKKGVH